MTEAAPGWGSYEKAKGEKGTLPPLEIQGEKFVFPSSPPADLVMQILRLAKKGAAKVTNDDAVGMMLDLLGDEQGQRLTKLVTWVELEGIIQDLFDAYGLKPKKDEAGGDPNQKGAPTSAKKSSTDSEPSKPTSVGSTA